MQTTATWHYRTSSLNLRFLGPLWQPRITSNVYVDHILRMLTPSIPPLLIPHRLDLWCTWPGPFVGDVVGETDAILPVDLSRRWMGSGMIFRISIRHNIQAVREALAFEREALMLTSRQL